MKKCPKCFIEKPLKDFYPRKEKKGTYYRYICKMCDKERILGIQNTQKQKWVDYKGGKCQKCGYNKCLAALEFHHRDPLQKKFALSGYRLTKSRESEIIEELEKCDLLCSNCHREVEYM